MTVALDITLMIDLNGKAVIGPFSNYGLIRTDLQRSPSCEVDISPWKPKTELLRRANFNLEAGFPMSRSFPCVNRPEF